VHGISDANLTREPNKWILGFPETREARLVLDIACGMGYDSIAWARAGKVPVGVDINFELLKAASQLARSLGLKIHFVVADSTKLPFKQGTFDISFSENLFEHVPMWRNIIEETQRVLKKGGVFFVRTTNHMCPRNPEINHMHFYPLFPEFVKRPILSWIMKHRRAWVNFTNYPAINWFTHRGLAEAFHNRGFETYEIFDLTRPDNVSTRGRKIFWVLNLLKKSRALRYLAYPMMRSVQILAVKRVP
jgi:ubiquinone/menaquinone biosynthesis C-methylase UbiE